MWKNIAGRKRSQSEAPAIQSPSPTSIKLNSLVSLIHMRIPVLFLIDFEWNLFNNIDSKEILKEFCSVIGQRGC